MIDIYFLPKLTFCVFLLYTRSPKILTKIINTLKNISNIKNLLFVLSIQDVLHMSK